jgi:trigger factor
MKIEITDLSPVKKSLAVEVDVEEVSKETDAVLRRYAGQVRLPGFRQGKAPVDMVRKRFAKEIDDDVRERLISRLWREATSEKGLSPLGDPVLEDLKHEHGMPFGFKTTFEVLPKFEVKDYQGVEAKIPSSRLDDSEVDEALEAIRQSHARYVADEARLAEFGDVIVADVDEQPEGEEAKKRERLVLEVGAPRNPEPFNAKILGVKTGAALAFDVEYPADHAAPALAGKRVSYRILVHEVKRKEIPLLDDDLAKDLGEFESLAALEKRVRSDLEARKAAMAHSGLRQAILDKVLLANPIPLPDVLVEEEIQHRLEDMVREMMLHGVDPRKAELDWKQLRDRNEEPARKIVHARLVLDAIASAEDVTVDRKDLDERIRREAERIGESYDGLRLRLGKGPGLQALETQMVREKSLDLITSIANIQGAE